MAPKLYELDPLDVLGDDLNALLMQLNAATLNNPEPNTKQAGKKFRVAAINSRHARVVGQCFVYRIALLDRSKLARIREIVSRSEKCTVHSLKTAVKDPKVRFPFPTILPTRSFPRQHAWEQTPSQYFILHEDTCSLCLVGIHG